MRRQKKRGDLRIQQKTRYLGFNKKIKMWKGLEGRDRKGALRSNEAAAQPRKACFLGVCGQQTDKNPPEKKTKKNAPRQAPEHFHTR